MNNEQPVPKSTKMKVAVDLQLSTFNELTKLIWSLTLNTLSCLLSPIGSLNLRICFFFAINNYIIILFGNEFTSEIIKDKTEAVNDNFPCGISCQIWSDCFPHKKCRYWCLAVTPGAGAC